MTAKPKEVSVYKNINNVDYDHYDDDCKQFRVH